MKLKNNTYDTLKWIALNLIPALEVLILTVGKIWGLPYYDNIGATVAAIGVFLAAVIGVSRRAYYQVLNEVAEEEGEEPEEE